MRYALATLLVLLASVFTAPAYAGGGHYTFDGGTRAQQATVTAALEASSFNWSLVSRTIRIRIAPDTPSEASIGVISLDANLLNAGTFSWGVVQHEYAHEVDFFLLTDATRAQLHTLLGGTAWWGTEGHSTLDCERFADLVAWAYWSSADNVMKPQSAQDEGGQVTPAVFRAALAAILPGLPTTSQPQIQDATQGLATRTIAASTPTKRHRKA